MDGIILKLSSILPNKRTMSFIEFLEEPDPIAFLCRVLVDESTPIEPREAAAQALRPYYHPMLALMGPYLERFLERAK